MLDGWARDSGASPRTVTRLFRSELGTPFVQWRQQVLLARAVTLAARNMPLAAIAAELGYASPSAFSAMVRRSVRRATPPVFCLVTWPPHRVKPRIPRAWRTAPATIDSGAAIRAVAVRTATASGELRAHIIVR